MNCKNKVRGSQPKIAFRLSVFALLVLLLVGCSANVKQMKFQDVAPKMEEQFQDTIMVEMTDSDFYQLFDLDPSQVVQHYYKYAFLDVRAEEVVMIELKNSSEVKDVEAVLWARVNELRDEFDGFIDEEKAIVDQAIVFTEGNYVFLLVGRRALDMQDYLISAFE